ncbi:hypothetical protein BC938DRAFT_477436 [Jimgerdemannia flammicorona]|uniref:Uncharacterized protein n=1 Tax=Jimgerdemannia flammicorona TaxID=994334 RepID=A0A433QPD3_9FUNG|nr:hypothetical protein BC938DRAFT_477436 [Jimgerdemannia flammicorona]
MTSPKITELATDVHPQVTALLKEQSMLNRQLIARDERIQSLEAQLQEAQDTLVAQNQRFEAQLQSVRDRLEQARSQKSQNAMQALNFGRIAKLMRGGIALHDDVPPSAPTTMQDKNDRRTSGSLGSDKMEGMTIEIANFTIDIALCFFFFFTSLFSNSILLLS